MSEYACSRSENPQAIRAHYESTYNSDSQAISEHCAELSCPAHCDVIFLVPVTRQSEGSSAEWVGADGSFFAVNQLYFIISYYFLDVVMTPMHCLSDGQLGVSSAWIHSKYEDNPSMVVIVMWNPLWW